ncbi:DUF4037 domain-containing protein [Microlunatus soli]|uniref:DUF4037 domain-containing protein n=1 Tax=Microlunatus soli TaxID=630515 RepID=UPI0038B414F9
MPAFVPALQLDAEFYSEVVAPLLTGLPHAAARLGDGSEILGFDTERSTDHGWGPALQLFTDRADEVRSRIEDALPETFHGWPVQYGWDDVAQGAHLEATTLTAWLIGRLGVDPRESPTPIDWLLMPQQQLLGLTRGRVYADPDGAVAAARSAAHYYPEQVWLWMMSCQWRRIAQVEAFVGRTAEVGDELGSRVLAGYLVRDLMRLAFLQERSYWPYQKWFGSAFAQLALAADLGPILDDVLDARDHPARERALVTGYELLAATHNRLGVTAPVEATARLYHGRPYRVIGGDRFADVLRAAVTDQELRPLPPVGSVDQFADSTDIRANTDRTLRLRLIYTS